MLEILSYFESIIRFISVVLSTGFSLKRLVELKDEYEWDLDNMIFIGSIIIGFILGIMFSYFKK